MGAGARARHCKLLIGPGHPAACRRICRRLELRRAFVPRWDARAYDAHGERGIVRQRAVKLPLRHAAVRGRDSAGTLGGNAHGQRVRRQRAWLELG